MGRSHTLLASYGPRRNVAQPIHNDESDGSSMVDKVEEGNDSLWPDVWDRPYKPETG